jgi:Gpi18-like mannosyltransferase
VPDQPEASSRVAGQRPYHEASHASSLTGGSAAKSRLPQRGRRESGLPGWLAVLLLIGIAGVGGLIDSVSGTAIRGAFNYSLVLASLVAIVLVRRSKMFNVVIAPPLVYFVASAGLLYVRTGGLQNRGKLIDAATNWVVYGFPAIAGATAVVLVVAGIRLMVRR